MKNFKSEEKYLNREISWLLFNERVVEESLNSYNPILERAKFLAISANNLDEFFSVRFAGLKSQLRHNIEDKSLDGLTPLEQINEVNFKAEMLINEQKNSWEKIKELLELENISFPYIENFSKKDIKFISNYFAKNIASEIEIIDFDDLDSKINVIPNLGISLAVEISKDKLERRNILMPLKQNIARMIALPQLSNSNEQRYVFLEEIILTPQIIQQIQKTLKNWKIERIGLIRITRDSELNLMDEAEDLLNSFEVALKKRKKGNVVRLSVNSAMPIELKETLINKIKIDEDSVEQRRGLLEMSAIHHLYDIARSDLKFKPLNIRFPERIDDFGGDCFAAINAKDIIVHHPYESFDVVVQFIKQATNDPNVTSIKQTIYRTSKESPIVEALIDAAKSGKEVVVVIEPKARFDEEANISWSKELKKAGAKVVLGVPDYKIHAKISLVKRRSGNKITSYVHFGTGNYHPITAKVYTDLSFFTSNDVYCADAEKIFAYMEKSYDGKKPKAPSLKKVIISPFGIRDKMLKLIKKEISNHKKNLPSGIWVKANALLDKQIIDALYEASEAGVNVDLVIRGICSLRAGVEGLSKNIEVKSVIGRFLEHSRIFCFADGNSIPSAKTKLYISSSDLMTRNLERRIETMVLIENSTVHEQVLNQIMVANMRDEKQSWILQSNGFYQRQNFDEHSFSAHEFFISNPSLSGRGSALRENRAENIRIRQVKSASEITKIAVIDIGSNSVRLVIYDGLKRVPLPVYNEKVLCGLASGMEKNGALNKLGVELTLKSLDRFIAIIGSMQVAQIYAFATSAARDSSDGEEFIKRIETRYEIKINILSGQEEARFAALGVASAFYEAQGVVGDLGGGSLELANFSFIRNKSGTAYKKDYMGDCLSFPIGALRLQTLAKKDLKLAADIADKYINDKAIIRKIKGNKFYAVGGGFRALAKIHMARSHHPLRIIEGYSIKPAQLSDTLDMLLDMKFSTLNKLTSISKKRAQTLPFVAVIMQQIIKHAKPSQIIFSAHGVREGIVFDKLHAAKKSEDALISGCSDYIDHISPDYGTFWRDYGKELFKWMSDLFPNETPNEERLRKAACILSGIAWSEHSSYRGEVAFRWVLNSEISAVAHKERMFIAVALYHRYRTAIDEKILMKAHAFLSRKEYQQARFIGILIKLGYLFSGGTIDILKSSHLSLNKKEIHFRAGINRQSLISEDIAKRFKSLAKEYGFTVDL